MFRFSMCEKFLRTIAKVSAKWLPPHNNGINKHTKMRTENCIDKGERIQNYKVIWVSCCLDFCVFQRKKKETKIPKTFNEFALVYTGLYKHKVSITSTKL